MVWTINIIYRIYHKHFVWNKQLKKLIDKPKINQIKSIIRLSLKREAEKRERKSKAKQSKAQHHLTQNWNTEYIWAYDANHFGSNEWIPIKGRIKKNTKYSILGSFIRDLTFNCTHVFACANLSRKVQHKNC